MMRILAIDHNAKRLKRRLATTFSILVLTLSLAAMLAPTATASKTTGNGVRTSPSLPSGVWSEKNAATIGAAAEVVTALSVIFLIAQILQSQRTAKSERTRGFQERHQEEAFYAAVSRTVGCTTTRDAGDCVDFFEALFNRHNTTDQVLPRVGGGTKASVVDIDRTLSLFEEMGAAFKRRQLDKQALRVSFAMPTLQLLTTAWWLICWEREGRLPGQDGKGGVATAYQEFQKMCEWIQKKEKLLAQHESFRPKDTIRALCIPQDSERPLRSSSTWRISRRLSLALSKLVKQTEDRGDDVGNALSLLATDIESLHPAESLPAARGWQVVLIPKRIDQSCDDQWRGQWAAAGRLGSALDAFADSASIEAAVARVEEAASPT